MQPALTAEIPLVGRDVELARIVTALRDPEPAAFVLAGAAGVGKTRLAAEVAKAAEQLGFATAQVIGSRAAASIPFGSFAPLLPATDLVPGDLLGLLRQASDAIVEQAGPQHRLLLVVDDAHLLDDGSAALVHQLVLAASCSVVASVRTPGSAPDPVVALWKENLAVRIDLDPLGESDVEEVVARFLGGPIAGASVRRLWEVSGGNALWMRELLIGAAESNALREKGGMWSLRLPLATPGRLMELVESRLGGLTPDTMRVIEMLAVGEPLGLAMLEELTTADAIEDAERLGFVEVRQDGRRAEARLSHPIYGEVLRQSLPRSRLRRISATLARATEAVGAHRREDLLRVARWQLDAGVRGDPALLSRAAQRAKEMFDMELAGKLAQAAFDSGGGVEAGLMLGEAKFRSGHHESAETVLASLVVHCTNDHELSMVANARAYNLSNLMGDPAAVLDEALATVTDVTARLRLLGRLATNRIFEGEPGEALVAARELLDSGDDLMIGRGAYPSSIALALLGRGDEAVAMAQLGLEAHRRQGTGNQLPEAQLIGAVLGHAGHGRLAVAETAAADGYQACLGAGDREGQATFSFLRAAVLVERGLLSAASRLFLEGMSINRELGDTGALRWCTAGLALAEGMAGHAGQAAVAVAELNELPAGWMIIFELDVVERGRAWASVAGGELTRACELLREAAQRAAAGNQRVAEARLLHDIARLGDPASVASRLEELAVAVDGDTVATLAAHARALARASAQELDAAARRFDELGAAILAAESYQASATIHRSEGSARRATAAARRADELVALCGDVRTPGLARGTDTVALTRREREVAGLAAGGATSREIAAKLFVSVRTVDNHLQNVYSKLGVSSRDDLARALGQSRNESDRRNK
jgi:DNA-binding CsgD family transcriptional regulator